MTTTSKRRSLRPAGAAPLLVALSNGREWQSVKIDVVAAQMGTRLTLRAITEAIHGAIHRWADCAPDLDPAGVSQIAERRWRTSSTRRLERVDVTQRKDDTASTGGFFSQHTGGAGW